MKTNYSAKKVLAIHWKWSDINKDSWKIRKEKFRENWMELDLFQFAMVDDPSFEDWEKTFDEISFFKYDAIYTSSLWWIMILRYMYKNNIKAKRLIMAVPWISFKTLEWEKPNMYKLYKEFWNPDLSNIAWEIFVISTKDDEIVSYKSWKEIARMTNAEFILLEDWGHKLKWYLSLIISLVRHWKRD